MPCIPKNEDIHQMHARHLSEIDELQNSCKHENLSDFVEQFWAIGHSTGQYVRHCLNCAKIIEKKSESEYMKMFDESCSTQKVLE